MQHSASFQQLAKYKIKSSITIGRIGPKFCILWWRIHGWGSDPRSVCHWGFSAGCSRWVFVQRGKAWRAGRTGLPLYTCRSLWGLEFQKEGCHTSACTWRGEAKTAIRTLKTFIETYNYWLRILNIDKYYVKNNCFTLVQTLTWHIRGTRRQTLCRGPVCWAPQGPGSWESHRSF